MLQLSTEMCSPRAPSLRIPCGSAVSPGSPKSWEESLVELSKSLQVICGSPEDPSPSLGYLSPSKLSPPSPLQTNALSSIPELHRSISIMSPTWRSHAGVPWTPNASPPSVSPGTSPGNSPDASSSHFKPLLVRHEESHGKLQEKLAKICKTSKSDSTTPPPRPVETLKLRRDSFKSGFRFHQDVAEHDVDQMVVSVEGSILRVSSLTAGHSRTGICHMQLPPGTELCKMICTVSMCNTLYIRERTSCIYEIHSVGLIRCFLPIIIEDEANARVKCVLHIPDEFNSDDLNVKTLDDHLVITAQKHRHLSPMLKMVVLLPDGVESRTISAKMSSQNQLIVSGLLGSSNRRYTFWLCARLICCLFIFEICWLIISLW